MQLESQALDLGKAPDWNFEEVETTMINMFKDSLTTFSYEFILKKRLLKRLWGILILEIQNAELFFKKFQDSFKAWERFQQVTELHYETMKSIFQNIFKDS